MAMPSTVLIITNEFDTHADMVIRELNKRHVPVFRFHPEDFPQACSISLEIRDGRIQGEIVNDYHQVAFDDICASWYRQPLSLLADMKMTSTKLDNYVKAQSSLTLTALYLGLETFWVGHPYRLRRADTKALQLAEASKAGLLTPPTLISNDPTRVAAFLNQQEEMECAVKPLVALGVSDEQGYRLPLTTTVPKGHSLDAVALAPTIYQPYIPKLADIRCVVMGERIFAAKMMSQANDNTRMDWRGGECQSEIFSLPQEVERAILRLMYSFDINFASLDMVLTPEGELVFLELNPNGQWLWLEEELGFPLVASMADLLTTHHSNSLA